MLLIEEQKEVDIKKLKIKVQGWIDKEIHVELKNIEIYKKYCDKKGLLCLFALSVDSEDILKFRDELGVGRLDKLTLHCTLLEKKV